MNWTRNEEKEIEIEMKRKESVDYSFKKMALIVGMSALIFFAQALQSYESIECPCCAARIELEPPVAREVWGAGWYCDNCGNFQCHLQKCVRCGASRS